MAYGIQTFDASGNEIVGPHNRLSKYLGSVNTTTAAGSITDVRFANGTPWKHIIAAADFGNTGKEVTFSGTTMSWTASNFSSRIKYGIR